jgi:hypothetical protein
MLKGLTVEQKAEVKQADRSAKSVYKETLIYYFLGTCIAIGLLIWSANDNFIWRNDHNRHFKTIELHVLPFFSSVIALGVIWIARLTILFFRSSNIAPMSEADYDRLEDLSMAGDICFLNIDKSVRWSYAILLITAGLAFELTPNTNTSTFDSLYFWIPKIYLFGAAAVSAYDIILFCLVLLESVAVGFVFFQVITIGGWWIAGLIAYFIWLLFIGSLKGALLNLFTGLVLAIAYMMGGYIASLGAYAVLLIFGEIFMKPKNNNDNLPDYLK